MTLVAKYDGYVKSFIVFFYKYIIAAPLFLLLQWMPWETGEGSGGGAPSISTGSSTTGDGGGPNPPPPPPRNR